MKVLLTGATGYIGHRLAMRLAEDNFKVNALVRNPKSKNIPSHKNINLFRGNICDLNSINQAMKGCDYVLHTAAYTNLKDNNVKKFYDCNVIGTSNMLKAALEWNVKKMVYTSTLSVFGPALPKVPITEKQPRLTSYTNDYELTKAMSEEEVHNYVKQGLNCSILNVTRVYGPGVNTYSNGVNKLLFRILKDRRLYVPAKLGVEANYVFIEDVINAHLLALQKGKAGEKYIIGGENVDYNCLIEHVKRLSHSKIKVVKIDYDLIRSAFMVINGFNFIIGNNNTVTPKVLDSLFTNRSASSQKAISNLDYTITPLNVGLKKTIHFLSQN